MILEHISLLNQKHIVLASASPRRAQLLKQIGLTKFDVIPSSFDENLDKKGFAGPWEYAKATARCKAIDVAKTLREKGVAADLIISADTVVDIDGAVLEKPGDADEAAQMLRQMSGREHKVHTGFTLVASTPQGDQIQSSSTSTSVEFCTLSEAEIQAYIATGEPYGKAGAYGAQGPAGAWLKRLEGCYFNVMGLPLHDLAAAISSFIKQGLL